MAKKWSQKTEKNSLIYTDEFMIIDSEDPNPATQNKRVKASTAFLNGPAQFAYQTVGATTQQQTFIFNGGIALKVFIAAANVGNTKGLATEISVNCTLNNVNNVNQNFASDFVTANAGATTAANLITITLTGEAGETINWVGHFQIATI